MTPKCFQLENIVIEVKDIKKLCPAGLQVGDRFYVESLVPEGYCPFMYHSTVPYLDALENGAFIRQKENFIVVTCPNPKVGIAVKISQTKGSSITLEILSKTSDCPCYDLKIGRKWRTSKGTRRFCRQAFDSIFPYLSALSSEIRTGNDQNTFTATCPGYPGYVVFEAVHATKANDINFVNNDFVKIEGEKQMESSLTGKNVLITGAAYGIGAAFAKYLAKERCRLLLIDIDKDKLEEITNFVKNEGNDPIVMIKDLSKVDERESIFTTIAESDFDIDILINNVGEGFWSYFNDTSWVKIEEIIDTNVKCMTHMTRLALPGLLSKNSGHIVNMSSTAAFFGGPNGTCYNATKAYIRSFSESLEMELIETGVKVTCVFPGATETHFWEYANMIGSKYDQGLDKMTASEVVKETVEAIKKGKSTVITGKKNRLNMLIVSLLPRKILNKIALKRFNK